jgi:hypothetical protein
LPDCQDNAAQRAKTKKKISKPRKNRFQKKKKCPQDLRTKIRLSQALYVKFEINSLQNKRFVAQKSTTSVFQNENDRVKPFDPIGAQAKPMLRKEERPHR